MKTALVALGSNLGKRQTALRQAIQRLGQIPHTHVQAVATFRKTAPVNCPPGMPEFINTAAKLSTSLEIHKFFDYMHLIEVDLGRQPGASPTPEARTIDLDLIIFGTDIVSSPQLVVPHPRMQERLFVLQPLAEIAPEMPHPVLGKTMAELLCQLQSSHLPGRIAG